MPTYSPRVLVFDSGIGGMGVVQALRTLSPSLKIDYLADTALFPYGEQPDNLLITRIVTLLREAHRVLSPDLLIIACNTASTLALPAVREALPLPVVGCVPPIRWAGRVSTSRTIGLLATSATARRPYLYDLHQRFAADCRLIVHGSMNLAQLAEKAFRGEELSIESVAYELQQLFQQPGGEHIDTIGLGCTHYTFLMPLLRQLETTTITWLDPAPAVAQQALTRLSEHRNQPWKTHDTNAEQRCFVTALPTDGERLAHRIRTLGFSGCSLFPFPKNAYTY